MQGIGIYNTTGPEIKSDLELLEENVTRILFTLPGERVNNPNFGSKLKLFLFELETVMMEEVKSEIANSLARWEPRIEPNIIEIASNPEINTFSLKIEYVNKEDYEVYTYEKLIRL